MSQTDQQSLPKREVHLIRSALPTTRLIRPSDRTLSSVVSHPGPKGPAQFKDYRRSVYPPGTGNNRFNQTALPVRDGISGSLAFVAHIYTRGNVSKVLRTQRRQTLTFLLKKKVYILHYISKDSLC